MTSQELIQAGLKLLEILVSWPLLVLAFLLIFRKSVGELLLLLARGLKKWKGPLGELEFEPKKVETTLGKTEYTGVKVKTGNLGLVVVDDFQCSYIGPNFLISWPEGQWSGSTAQGAELHKQFGFAASRKIPLVITRKEKVDDFHPNVNVLVDLAGETGIEDIMAESIHDLKELGFTILSSHLDKETQAGFIDMRNTATEVHLHQFQRIVLAFGRAFIVTATLPESILREKLRAELATIINSFRIIV